MTVERCAHPQGLLGLSFKLKDSTLKCFVRPAGALMSEEENCIIWLKQQKNRELQ